MPGSAPHEAWKEGNNTTHYRIVDRFGNAVGVTYTLNDWFGASVTATRVPGGCASAGSAARS